MQRIDLNKGVPANSLATRSHNGILEQGKSLTKDMPETGKISAIGKTTHFSSFSAHLPKLRKNHKGVLDYFCKLDENLQPVFIFE